MTFSMTTSIPLCGRRQRTGSGQSWYVGYMVTVGHLVIVLLTWYLVTGYCNVLSDGTSLISLLFCLPTVMVVLSFSYFHLPVDRLGVYFVW